MSSRVEKKVIFSCPSLYVISQLFDDDDVVITFNNRGDLCGGDRFWGDSFFEKSGISAIGICATSANWFPPEDMERAIEAIHDAIGARSVITYGSSMGGYGALKFSRKLNAQTVLAFSPQWSINPEACGSYTYQYTEYYDKSLRNGDPILEHDLQGRCFIFLDNYEVPDIQHAERIIDMSKTASNTSCERVIAPFTWHGTVFHLTSAGSRYTLRMIKAAREKEGTTAGTFRRLLRESRHNSRHYMETRFFCLSFRMAKRCDASTRSLRHASMTFANQEARLIRALINCIEGNTEIGLAAITKEIERDWLYGTSDWAMTRILDIARTHNLKNAERLLRRCFRDRVPDNMHELMFCSNILADIGFGDEAAWEVASRLTNNPTQLSEIFHEIEAFANKVKRPLLVEILRERMISHEKERIFS